ncbi:iron chelate uptake ABC transporter family permease subunit [Phytoactinopolyspora alkaliphila]|uniref:Iron chelate uptake ABC transporter family permease subunit n=1 Tax=Phytoactinopolyspora alkaliphila TaxID=1783498 RepID=A0A6N9YHD1_9ACTN|nr:putative F420-0 ABC transporter permease subunit [Phytoactinopolyspora alkaliphila]NED94335.1 iron chelate uptake ABC transporter family permease subunit [Phytoactinopolyspora alkaliphila]
MTASLTSGNPATTESPPGPARRRHVPTSVWTAAMTAVLVASATVAVTIGSADIGALDVWRSIGSHVGLERVGFQTSLSELRDGIVWELRLPRVLTAAAVGAALAICGAVMQTLTRNPLAEPYLLGLSSGASVGAVVVLVLGVGTLGLPVAAFAGALLALAATLALASRRGELPPTRTILAGLAVSYLCSAVTSFVIFWSATGDSYRSILSWLLGSLGGASWNDVAVVSAAVAVVGTALMSRSRTLDAFAFGDGAASNLGINVNATRWTMLALVALLTGAAVAVSGAIGFVGLMLPHAVRLLVGAGHRRVLPLAALAGASFMIWADTVARTVFDPRELPVGVVTAFLGAPAFAVLLRRRKVGRA